jgi:hypothetical protein
MAKLSLSQRIAFNNEVWSLLNDMEEEYTAYSGKYRPGGRVSLGTLVDVWMVQFRCIDSHEPWSFSGPFLLSFTSAQIEEFRVLGLPSVIHCSDEVIEHSAPRWRPIERPGVHRQAGQPLLRQQLAEEHRHSNRIGGNWDEMAE